MTLKDIKDKSKIPFDGSITRSRAKKIQEATHVLIARLGALVEASHEPPYVTILSHRLDTTKSSS